jgi:hypothetical protein
MDDSEENKIQREMYENALISINIKQIRKERYWTKIKGRIKDAAIISVMGLIIAGIGLGVYKQEINNRNTLAEQKENVKKVHRLDSLQNIDNLASRLDGYCPDCSYFGGYNFVDSLQKRYLLEEKIFGISFEDYLTNLYVEQQKAKALSIVQ